MALVLGEGSPWHQGEGEEVKRSGAWGRREDGGSYAATVVGTARCGGGGARCCGDGAVSDTAGGAADGDASRGAAGRVDRRARHGRPEAGRRAAVQRLGPVPGRASRGDH